MQKQQPDIKQLLFFDQMVIPKIITLLYWFLLLMVVIGAVGAVFSANGVFSAILKPVGILIGGALFVRLMCEGMIVMFKINEALQDIRQQGKLQAQDASE